MIPAALVVFVMYAEFAPEFPEVRLADGGAFGVHSEDARYFWLLARDHAGRMRPTVACDWNNPPDVIRAWEAECAWRHMAWYHLDDVLYCNIPVRSKLRALDALRRHIGDADYAAGKMPAPIPSAYRIPYNPAAGGSPALPPAGLPRRCPHAP